MGALGVRGKTGWDSYIQRIAQKANNCSQVLGHSVCGRSPLHMSTAVSLFKVLVRPVLEYANGIWAGLCTKGNWRLLESVQVRFGRRVLQLQPSIAGTYVRRELGLQSLKERGDIAMLRYFGKLCGMDKERLAARVFRLRCETVDKTDHAQYSWCRAASEALSLYGFEDEWFARSVDQETWGLAVKRAVRPAFAAAEDTRMQGRPSLAVFCQLGAGAKGWLDHPLNHAGEALRFRFRCGGAPLMQLVGQKSGDLVCRMCDSGEVESAQHFACHCANYEDQRQECLQEVLELLAGHDVPELRMAVRFREPRLFLGDALPGKLSTELRRKVDRVLCDFLKVAWRRRSTQWEALCVPGTKGWRLR
jgi:hypothetical protein